MNPKIKTRQEILQIVKELRDQGKKIVFTNGCFDILHVGHIKLLKEAKSFGDILILGVNTDSSVKKLKGPSRPINSQEDRIEVVASTEHIDYVVLFDEDTPIEIIGEIKPHIHVKGGDYTPEIMPESKAVYENGGEIKIIKFVEGKSTTNIINKSKEK